MDTWHDVGHTSNLSLSWDKRGIRAKRSHFLVLIVRERIRAKASSHDLRSSVGRFSSGQERKFIASTRGKREYQKKRDFTEVPRGEISEIKGCRV